MTAAKSFRKDDFLLPRINCSTELDTFYRPEHRNILFDLIYIVHVVLASKNKNIAVIVLIRKANSFFRFKLHIKTNKHGYFEKQFA